MTNSNGARAIAIFATFDSDFSLVNGALTLLLQMMLTTKIFMMFQGG
jgi:hypothetical protein